MNKPYSMIIDEFKQKIIDDINKSGLHISVVDMIFQQIAEQINLSAKQVAEQEKQIFADSQKKESEKESEKKTKDKSNNEKEGN